MAATHDEPPTLRGDSPSPETAPTPALGASLELSRSLSTASSASHGSATTDASHVRESLGSDMSSISRHSSASFQMSRRSDVSNLSASSRQSTGSFDRPVGKRRGYMRPHGTEFAHSARSRESVLSLGSIAHLQYYFARTGLLDGKGGQLARKRAQKARTLDLSSLDTTSFSSSLPTPKIVTSSDADSSYASMGSSPDLVAHSFGIGAGQMVESPIQEEHNDHPDEYYSDDFEEPDPGMLPPTASTYNYREKPLPKPPSIAELKAELKSALDAASQAVQDVKGNKSLPPPPDATEEQADAQVGTAGWYEIQGMHILDVMTLAIRAAKVYYTSHEHPDRLDAIKSEKEIRSELLAVMDVLKRMASRLFTGGMREDELKAMDAWISGLYHMLKKEEDMEAAEKAERTSWTWVRDEDWPAGTEIQREYAFMLSMLDGDTTTAPAPDGTTMKVEPLPSWTPIDRSAPLDAAGLPTPFLKSLQNGLRLVQLHNAAVRKSKRRFGTIGPFHTDTQKPYRCADNLRYWLKAAELRWEILLRVDALGVVYNSKPDVWLDLEDAVLKWCRKVREEITSEIQG